MAIGAPVSPVSGGGTPSGAIMLNDNDGAALPTGFVLCDGANGTPDMRGRYPKGAAGTGDEGNTGGSNTVTLATADLPSHNHGISTQTVSFSNHTHGGGGVSSGAPEGSSSANTGNAGSGSAHQNQPSFIELRWMMKT